MDRLGFIKRAVAVVGASLFPWAAKKAEAQGVVPWGYAEVGIPIPIGPRHHAVIQSIQYGEDGLTIRTKPVQERQERPVLNPTAHPHYSMTLPNRLECPDRARFERLLDDHLAQARRAFLRIYDGQGVA
jgi:hypothetical protein